MLNTEQVAGNNFLKKSNVLKLLILFCALICINSVYADETIDSAKTEKTSKIDLKAVIFDPEFDNKEEIKVEELSDADKIKYNLHEALHGEVKAISTKGLFADKMTVKFDEGPIKSIVPWIDYNGSFSNVWTGDNYTNTFYGINFADVGFNINMRDDKTFVRVMFSPVRYVEGNTYFQSFFADNYITRKISKNNTLLVGHTWVPLGIEGKGSPLILDFFTRSQTSRTYSSVRALGTKLMGNYKYADYQVGFYSSGRFFKDFFPGPEVAAWVDFKPLANTKGEYGKLTVSGGFDGGNAQSNYAVGTAAVNYEYKRLRLTTEMGIADGSNGATGFTSNKSGGVNTTLTYRVTPKTQVLFRFDQFDPNTEKANDVRKEYTAGINYFIKDEALRLIMNFTHYEIENGAFGDRIMVGTQIIL